MTKWLIPALTASLVLAGCSSVPRGSIPVVDSGSSVSSSKMDNVKVYGSSGSQQSAPQSSQAQAIPADSGVVVMVPGGVSGSAPLDTSSAPISTQPIQAAPIQYDSAPSTSNTAPAINSSSHNSGGLAADEQLDGPVLALLTTAQEQQSSGDLNGAASSLERAQRIAPREPQVLYSLAQVRLAQGDAAQAEQFARRGLSYASGRPALQASLWDLIAQSRQAQGDAAGAAQARERAKVSL